MRTFAGLENSAALFNDKIKSPCLKKLYMKFVDSVEEVWDLPPPKTCTTSEELSQENACGMDLDRTSHFQPQLSELKKIYIEHCGALKSLGPASIASALLHLHGLTGLVMFFEAYNFFILT